MILAQLSLQTSLMLPTKLLKPTSEHYFAILFTVFFQFLAFTTDIKSLLFVFFTFATLVFLICKVSIIELLFLLILFVFSFEKGLRGWNLVAASQGAEEWMSGYSIYFGVSLRFLLIAALFLILLPKIFAFIRNSNLHIKKIMWVITTFFCIAFLSTIRANDYFLALFGFLRIIEGTLLFFSTIVVLNNKAFHKYFVIGITSLLLCNSIIGILQYTNNGPLHLFLEDSTALHQTGYFTTDGEKSFRSSGLLGHPTFFASYLSILYPIVLGSLLSSNLSAKKINFIFLFHLISLVLGAVTIFATLSRSAWVAFAVYLVVYIVALSKSVRLLKLAQNKITQLTLTVILVLVLTSERLVERVSTIANFFSTGSGAVRLLLIEQAVIMTQTFPFLGAGLNHFTRMMITQEQLPPNLRGFMFPVHNTFLLFSSELGMLAVTLFVIFILYILGITLKKSKKNLLSLGFWLAVIGFIINAQFHALFNQDPSLDLLFIVLAYLTSISAKKTTPTSD